MDNILNRVDHYFGNMKTRICSFHKNERGLMDAVNIVLALVMIVVIGAIGIFVADKTLVATGTPSDGNLTTMKNNLLDAGKTGSSFVVILVIAFIGGIAISYLTGMFGKRRK